MITNQVSLYYPNVMGRIILKSLEDVIGTEHLHSILNQADMTDLINEYPPDDLERSFPFERLSLIQDTLEKEYGLRGGRGIALRVGRGTFKYGLRKFSPILGFNELSFRLSPLAKKIHSGVDLFAGVFNYYSDQIVRVESNDKSILWHIDRCPICWGRTSEDPACHLAEGLLQEALYWASGGKYYKIEETDCIAKGDLACTFRIEKLSLD